jgi:hypothetical protein
MYFSDVGSEHCLVIDVVNSANKATGKIHIRLQIVIDMEEKKMQMNL